MRRFFLLTLLLSLAGSFLPPAISLASAAEELVIISPHWEGIRNEFARAFAGWYRDNGGVDIEVTWLDQGGTSDDLRFIRSGFSRSPEGIDVDLFYGGGLDPYVELAGEGLLVPYELPAEILEPVPQHLGGVPLYDEEYRWYGTSLAGFGILYNKKILKMFRLPEPSTWENLASPEYLGLVGSSDPRHSGSTHMMYEIILQSYGWERGWETLIAMGGNVRNFPKSSSQISKDLAVGEVAAGLSIDTYAFSAIEDTGADRLGFVLPEKATVITPDPIAILKGAPNPAAAKAFIRFTLSPAGQKIWMYKKGAAGGPEEVSLNKMSVLPMLYGGFRSVSNVTVNPFEQEGGFMYDFEKGSARWSVLNDLVGAFIIDTHAELAAAWEAAMDNEKKKTRLLAPPVTEQQAMELAAGDWKDPVKRNETINKWLSSARDLYGSF